MAYGYSEHFIALCVQWSSIALLYYDYILTFPREVKYIWRSKFSLHTILYILCRYALVANLLYLLAVAGRLTRTCDLGYRICSGLGLLGRIAIVFVWTARTWAIYDRNLYILGYLAFLGVATIVLDATQIPFIECEANLPKISVVLTVVVCAFEMSSAGLTIFRLSRVWKYRGDVDLTRNRPLVCVLLEGGVKYLSLVLLLTLASLALNIRASDQDGFLGRLLNALARPVSGLMTARFLLDLRKWKEQQASGSALSRFMVDLGQTPSCVQPPEPSSADDTLRTFAILEPESEERENVDWEELEGDEHSASGSRTATDMTMNEDATYASVHSGRRDWDRGEGSSSQC